MTDNAMEGAKEGEIHACGLPLSSICACPVLSVPVLHCTGLALLTVSGGPFCDLW